MNHNYVLLISFKLLAMVATKCGRKDNVENVRSANGLCLPKTDYRHFRACFAGIEPLDLDILSNGFRDGSQCFIEITLMLPDEEGACR